MGTREGTVFGDLFGTEALGSRTQHQVISGRSLGFGDIDLGLLEGCRGALDGTQQLGLVDGWFGSWYGFG
jgi:hypothetical protein